MKIIIIGGGASGLMAATQAKKEDNEVIILEAHKDIGKKILITGNGRCNYWHDNITIANYYTDNEANLNTILSQNEETLNCLNDFGLVPTVKDGYYYPQSKEAKSVRDLFNYQITKKNIQVIPDFEVSSLKKENNQFIISNGKSSLTCDKVILSCGSNASTNQSMMPLENIIKSLGHQINPIMPSLVPLIVKDAKRYNWSGIRTNATLTLISDNKVLKIETGELQLTSNGISGICSFNLSGIISRKLNNHEDVRVYINFLPTIDNVEKYLQNRSIMLNNPTINELLNTLINYKLIGIIASLIRINTDTHYEDLSEKEKAWLINNLTNFECLIEGTEDFNKAQVCTGGIPLREINPETMESLIVKNLYITGEILDVDGECGGYNLAFAFTTGLIAGKESAK